MKTYNQELAANLRHWDELARLHPRTAFYGHYLERLRGGASALHRLEISEVGDVAGKSLLHLQCHIGTESISWSRLGARVTAVDFSADAIVQAERLATECEADVRFIQSDVYELPAALDESFDVVFCSWGVLCWLPDIPAWARVVSRFLKPGGIFYIAEFHPFMWVFDDTEDQLRVRYPYFGAGPERGDRDGSYADPDASLAHRTTFNWAFPIGLVVTALIESGLRLEFLHEHPRCVSPVLGALLTRDDSIAGERWFRLRDGQATLPLAFSLRARKD
ncbi:MAG: class I SAM-dependent methyltransferase [Chloroflexi bacterium]|nr:MAG: class I SAM-dependent methyltransferase [Chloroflexota bacterium]